MFFTFEPQKEIGKHNPTRILIHTMFIAPLSWIEKNLEREEQKAINMFPSMFHVYTLNETLHWT